MAHVALDAIGVTCRNESVIGGINMFCACGCGFDAGIVPRTYSCKGWIKGDNKKYIQGQHLHSKSFMDYDIDPNSGCWIWQRAVHTNGYGHIWADNKHQRAHRVYYERYRGAIPVGMVLDHLCRNKKCVNPYHLEVVTQKENIQRAFRKPREEYCGK